MKTIINRGAVVLAGLVLTGAGAWIVKSGYLGGHFSVIEPKGVATAAFQRGERHEYGLTFASAVGIDEHAALAVKMRGEWAFEAIDVQSEWALLAATVKIEEFHVENADGGRDVDMEEIRSAFAKPFFFTVDKHGTVLGTRTDGSVPSLVEGIVRSLVGYSAFDRRALEKATYESTEVDSTGRYTASYARRPEGSYVRAKRKYLEVLGATGALPGGNLETDVVSSESSFVFDVGRLARLTVHEHVIARGTGLPDMHSRTELSLEFRRTVQDVGGKLLASAGLIAPKPLYHRAAAQADLARMHEKRARDLDVATIATKLLSLKPGDDQQRAALYGSAKDLLSADATAIPAALSELHKNPKDRLFWVSALGAAGTPTAQQALSKLYDEKGSDPNARRDIVRSLSLVDEHTPATVEKLQSIADDPLMGRQAKFGLGTAVNHLKVREPERAAQLLAFLEQGFAASNDESDRVNYLKAIGNSGMESGIDLLVEQLSSPSNAVRAQALRALRLMPEGRADDILAREMVSDYDFQVRAAAVRATTERAPTEVVGRALLELLQNEKTAMVRQEAYRTFATWGPSAPYFQQALAWAETNERDPEMLAALATHT